MKEIKAKQGCYLTQNKEVGDDRIFISAIKGVNVNESDWREATEEEKVTFEKYLDEKQKQTEEHGDK